MSQQYILVTLEPNNKLPLVLEDYLYSLNIFDKSIHLYQLTKEMFDSNNDIYIFTQMWLPTDRLTGFDKNRLIYLNVEMLTESNRITHLIELIEYGIKIADYSATNLRFLIKYMRGRGIEYYNQLIYLPYQYQLRDQLSLENIDGNYEYDVGMINALPKQDESVNSSLTYRRTEIWNNLQSTDLKCINIIGWGKERDEQIKRCRIILNIHHFECFNVFEHIRCDRLIFAKKLIISDESIFMDTMDIHNHVITEKFENIISKTLDIIKNFQIYKNLMSKVCTNSIIRNRQRLLNNQLTKLNEKQFNLRSDIINSNLISEEDCYLEIGIENGHTFRAIKSLNKIGVDPSPKYQSDNIIIKTSDDFFADNKQRFDSIFIDGMHQSDYVLRDFNNAIDILNLGGIIYLDDIFPVNEREQLKIPIKHYYDKGILKYGEPWTGDVWKILYYLIQVYKNDIQWKLHLSPSYRGVIELRFDRTVKIPESAINIIESYDYVKDFDDYYSILVFGNEY